MILCKKLYKDFYLKKDVGFTEAEFQTTLEEFLGEDMDDFFTRFVYGTETPDYKKYFEAVGLFFYNSDDQVKPFLGARTTSSGGNVIITGITAGSPAEEYGLSVNDEILAINGYRMDQTAFDLFIKTLESGDIFEILVSRDSVLKTYQIKMGGKNTKKYMVKPDFNDTSQKKFDYWLRVDIENIKGRPVIYKIVPRYIIRLLLKMGIFLLIFSLCRVLFLIFNLASFPIVYFTDFLAGMWFDLVTVAIVFLPLGALETLPNKWRGKRWFQIFLAWGFHITLFLCVLINLIDIEYFKFTAARSTTSLFTMLSFGDDLQQQLPSFITGYWYLLLFLIVLQFLGTGSTNGPIVLLMIAPWFLVETNYFSNFHGDTCSDWSWWIWTATSSAG
ncbi:MAG: PDZ domain-containing protein [Crocinitomicaceae bacterium]|nr:PDZ domain-containing protein [Crocinitomicaceae bacterium]